MRAASVARTIDASGVRSAAVANIESQEWSKFTAWIGLATLAVTTRANSWKYLGDSDAARALDLLAALSHTADFSVGCYCENEAYCHRSVLRAVLAERGAKFG